MWIVIAIIATAVVFYLIGSNNPLPSVKAKIIAKAKETAAGL
jgi:hypothetical protein